MTQRWFRGMAIAAVLLLWALPLYWMLIASVTPEARLFGDPSLVPSGAVLDHYRALFAERQFWRPIRNSRKAPSFFSE